MRYIIVLTDGKGFMKSWIQEEAELQEFVHKTGNSIECQGIPDRLVHQVIRFYLTRVEEENTSLPERGFCDPETIRSKTAYYEEEVEDSRPSFNPKLKRYLDLR